ncbi:MAG: ferric reductase-like transmembrane domain-containing protein [Thermoplasmatota archaeon]
MGRAKWILTGTALLAGLAILFAIPATGQSTDSGIGGDSKCLSCHQAEGMTYVQILMPTITEVPQGQDFNVTVKIVDPWKHHIENASVSLNLTDAPGLTFVGGVPPVFSQFQGSLGPGATDTKTFAVGPNATEMNIGLVGDDSGFSASKFSVHIFGSDGHPWNGTPPSSSTETIHLSAADIQAGGLGTWKLTVQRSTPVTLPLASPSQLEGPYKVTVGIYGNVTGVNEIYVGGPARLNYGQNGSYTFHLHATPSTGTGRILYKVTMNARADVPTDHQAGHPADQQDLGHYIEWHTTAAFKGGTEYIATSSALPPVGPPPTIFIDERAWGYALGYGATFSLIPSLVLGGTFSAGSVTWLNRFSGGARRRVLWHNASSFALMGFAGIHTFLFLWEPAKPWTDGAIWGEAALASMVLLGLTGAIQRSFVERWGFATWRYMHFGIAMLTIAFTLLHLGIDGTHFQFLRDMV